MRNCIILYSLLFVCFCCCFMLDHAGPYIRDGRALHEHSLPTRSEQGIKCQACNAMFLQPMGRSTSAFRSLVARTKRNNRDFNILFIFYTFINPAAFGPLRIVYVRAALLGSTPDDEDILFIICARIKSSVCSQLKTAREFLAWGRPCCCGGGNIINLNSL